jgi:hypothetical protein
MRFLLSAVLLTCSAGVSAQTDVSGARDPLGLARFPHSWIVSYARDDEYRTREFVVSRVDKTRRDVRVEHEVRAPARLETATYEMPAGARRRDVEEHYLALLGAGEFFQCRGRDCGRSNHWANYIFKQAILYGPDRNQFYFAGEHLDHLIALYVIERGNKRVYAYIEVLEPRQHVAIGRNAEAIERLAGNGFSVVEGVHPLADGLLPDPAIAELSGLADRLDIFAGQTIYVVCHLYGSASASQLLANAQRCSAQAAELLTRTGGPELVPFAAGPLLPREVGNISRVELVLPHRLEHR